MSLTLSPLEQIKAGIDPYAGGEVFARLARGSVADITPADDVIMRWHGLYRHRPLEAGLFMLRLKLPGGVITGKQLRVAADIAVRAGSETIDLTTRQDIQFHRLALADLPETFAALEAAGLTALGACGDQVRNVVNCPLAGRHADELVDTRATAEALTRAFLGNPAFANLPRKFKIAVAGCPQGCVPWEINDLALLPAFNRRDEPGYALFIGGGLSVHPRFASPLDGWIAPELAVEVAARMVEIFRDHGEREQRGKARLKHLLAARGQEWFREELENRLGFQLQPVATIPLLAAPRQDHLGLIPQRDGLHALGIPVAGGRLLVEQARALSALGGEVRLTHRQNLLLIDILASKGNDVLNRLADAGLPVTAAGWRGNFVTCTGKEFCNKASVHTKERALQLLAELEQTPLDQPITLGMSGCPNGCGQHALADIGLQGRLAQGEECFDLWVGGNAGGNLGQRLQTAVPPERLAAEIRTLLDRYRREAAAGESFSVFAQRED